MQTGAPPYNAHQHTGAGGDGLGGAGGGPHTHPAGLTPSAHGSAASVPHDKFEVLDGHVKHGRNWKKIAAAAAVVLVVVGLALGLGLGLGLRGRGGSGSGGNSGTNTNGTGPANTSTPTLARDLAWQIVLSETLTLDNESASTSEALVTPNTRSTTNVSLYDIDMFLHQNLTVVRDLRADGLDVICYFSAGSYEPNRPDSWKFHDDDLGNELDGWPGEYWLDLNSDNVRQIMTARIEIAAQMNCTGIDPDNVDGYDNDNGLDLTQDDSIAFMKFLSNTAATYGLMTGLKNAGDIIDDVLDYVQFSVNEQCVQYGECDQFTPFTDADKPVFHIEYPAGTDETNTRTFATNTVSKYCDIGVDSGADGFNTVLKYMNLSGWVQYCDDRTYITDGY